MKSDDTKEKIIFETIELIQEMNGETDQVTIRKIAEKAKVGTGLINHYFESKDNLIRVCVQRIIGQVVCTFKVEGTDKREPVDITKAVACQVTDFLMENEQIARISILGDLSRPQKNDNSMRTALGFAKCMAGDAPVRQYMQKAFFLVSILQESFLRREEIPEITGTDFYDKQQRDVYIEKIVSMVMVMGSKM